MVHAIVELAGPKFIGQAGGLETQARVGAVVFRQKFSSKKPQFFAWKAFQLIRSGFVTLSKVNSFLKVNCDC